MPPAAVQIENVPDPAPLILKIEESELSEQREMERFLDLVKNIDYLDSSVINARGSSLARRKFEEDNHLPKGGMDYIAFLSSPDYINKINRIISEYNRIGPKNEGFDGVMDLIMESGSDYGELIPFLVREKINIISNLNWVGNSIHRIRGVPVGSGGETFTYPFVPVAFAAVAVVVAGVAAVYAAVTFWTSIAISGGGDCY